MPNRIFALVLIGTIAAAGLTVTLASTLPGHGMTILIPLALVAALLVRLSSRK
ncbi:MAG: hypothetical protein ACP5EN_10075 [Rhodovulum sp.]